MLPAENQENRGQRPDDVEKSLWHNISKSDNGEAMKGTMVVLPAREKRALIHQFSRTPTLEELKAGIGGGYLELIPGFTTVGYAGVVMTCVAFCDEDGKRKELAFNETATQIWQAALRRRTPLRVMPDHLVGDVVILFGDREFMGSL
jgi:hypothetical protein